MEFMALGVLGLGLAFALLGGDDDPVPEIDEELPPDEDQTIQAESDGSYLGGTGDDRFFGGDGSDRLTNVTIDGGDGDDLFDLIAQDSNIAGGDGNDNFRGYYASSLLRGGIGDDSFDIDASNSTISGGDGDDSFNVRGDGILLSGDAGDDLIDAREMHRSVASGGEGDDLLITRQHLLDEGANTLMGGEGDDTLRAFTQHSAEHGDDLLVGGEGADNFEIAFDPPYSVYLDDSFVAQDTIATIADFTAGEDRLTLDISLAYGDEGAEISIVELPDNAGSRVVISSTALADDPSDDSVYPITLESWIDLPGAHGVTEADIQLASIPR